MEKLVEDIHREIANEVLNRFYTYSGNAYDAQSVTRYKFPQYRFEIEKVLTYLEMKGVLSGKEARGGVLEYRVSTEKHGRFFKTLEELEEFLADQKKKGEQRIKEDKENRQKISKSIDEFKDAFTIQYNWNKAFEEQRKNDIDKRANDRKEDRDARVNEEIGIRNEARNNERKNRRIAIIALWIGAFSAIVALASAIIALIALI